MSLDDFAARWPAFVARWSRAGEDEARELIERVLATGLPVPMSPGLSDVPSAEHGVACERAVIAASGGFDGEGYRLAHSDDAGLAQGTIDPLDHFCQEGWQQLRNPRPDFDVDWYLHTYLDPGAATVNPLLHHLLVGRHAGHATVRQRHPVRADAPTGRGARRVCLFAAHDVDGIVDPHVVGYLTELSRYADVYYLADGYMSESELGELSVITQGAWGVSHAGDRLGSFAMLANDLVGWDVLDTYDELMLADDTCYLVRELGPVFGRMDDVQADWWGLQPTKRDFRGVGGDNGAIGLSEAKELHSAGEDWGLRDQLHVTSSFALFRTRVMNDPGFRSRLRVVSHESLIATHEISISNHLLSSGFDVATFIDALYPFSPLLTADHFVLLEQGFPLLQRALIAENPLGTADLNQWKSRVLDLVPDAPVDVIEDNLLRVAADDQLQRSFGIVTGDDGAVIDVKPLYASLFVRKEREAPRFEHWWAFPVCAYDHTFAGNERAVFEEVKDDPSIKKIILTRSRRIDLTGENVVIVPLRSREGQHHLMRAGQIFVKHGPTNNLLYRIDTTTHNVVNLWHGIPLKRFGMASAALDDSSRRWAALNGGGSRAVVTSSRMDSLAMSSAFFPASYPDMWPTGLPRNDFVVRDEDLLPPDLRADVLRLRDEVAGRRLVMFLPTFRDGQGESQYAFDESELERLADWASRHDAVIGIREHMADRARTYSSSLLPMGAVDMSARRYPVLESLYRVADALISDYSSCLVDFLLTGKPVVSFAYDYDRYASEERGLFYELDRVLPGPVCRTFDELNSALDGVFDRQTDDEREEYEWKRGIFFDHLDDQASWRVVQRVKSLYIDTP